MSEPPPRVCVVTGSRADYGLLSDVLRLLQQAGALQLVATCMHFSREFGYTVAEIERDGFRIDRRVDMLLAGGGGLSIAKSVGVGTISLADAFHDLNPDLVVILGDRFEALAAAQAAFFLEIPIAHLHGGEVTLGSLDDSTRHAITKLSRYHLVANADAGRRVRQLGEAEDRIFVTGAPGLDSVRRGSGGTRAELAQALGLERLDPFLLVTYHPVTNSEAESDAGLEGLLAALTGQSTHAVVVTGANADAGGGYINRRLAELAAAEPERVRVRASLGHRLYLTAMRECAAVVGNSSSGIIEAPLLKKPTVNIGSRQTGRPAAATVIHCPPEAAAIAGAIERAVSPAFVEVAAGAESLYGDGRSSPRIAALLLQLAAGRDRSPKRFRDLSAAADGLDPET